MEHNPVILGIQWRCSHVYLLIDEPESPHQTHSSLQKLMIVLCIFSPVTFAQCKKLNNKCCFLVPASVDEYSMIVCRSVEFLVSRRMCQLR